MKTINELYVVYFNYNAKPLQVPALWKSFSEAYTKVSGKELEVPLYVEVCAKYARANE